MFWAADFWAPGFWADNFWVGLTRTPDDDTEPTGGSDTIGGMERPELTIGIGL